MFKSRFQLQMERHLLKADVFPVGFRRPQGDLPFKSRKQGERDAECKAAFLKDWYNNSKKGAKGGDGFGAFDFMVGWTRG